MERARNIVIAGLESTTPYILAVMCARAWSAIVFSPDARNFAFTATSDLSFDISYALLGIVVALAARKVAPLQDRRGLKVALGCCLYASTLCWSLSFVIPELSVLGSVLGGAGLSLLYLLFAEAILPLGMMNIAFGVAAARFAGVPAVYLADGLDEARAAFAAFTLPAIALLAVSMARRTTSSLPMAKPPYPHFSFPWKPIALLALYAFIQGLRQHEFVGGAGVHSAFSGAVAMALVLAAIVLFSDRLSLVTLYRSPMPLMVLGLLLIPVGEGIGSLASGYLISISTSLLSYLVTLLVFDLCKRMGAPVIAPMGLIKVMPVITILGQEAAKFIDHAPIAQQTQDIILAGTVIATVFVASAIILSEKELTSTWGMRVLDKGALSEEARREDRINGRCDELTRQYRLTPREDEVLRQLAQGKTNAAIEKELFIASGTLKAHISHIYTKLDVHSKKELSSLFSDVANESPKG